MSDEERIKELENSLSIALDINDKDQREHKKLHEEIYKLKKDLARSKEDHQFDNLVNQEEIRKIIKK